MKKFAWLMAIVAIACVPAAAHAQAKMCFADKKVAGVYAGNISYGTAGPDYGDAVYFKLEDGASFPLNKEYNLDHNRGQALHRVLLTALEGQYKINGFDHYGGTCDDVDQIALHR